MIYHPNKCIFIQQRKCASTSITSSFGLTLDDPEWHFMCDGVLCPEYFSTYDLFGHYYKFSVVRNPWDRFISGYLYCEGTKNRTLRDILLHLPQLEHDYVHITRLQRAILYDRAGYPIVDKIMRFERLPEDFDHVCDIIGRPRAILPRLLVQDRLPYQHYFDRETKDLFMKHFGPDVETFGYEFDDESPNSKVIPCSAAAPSSSST